jgi:ketosteroid isomerase-like protein
LYTADATLTRPNGESVTGRAAIEQSYASASPTRRTRHVCSNTLIEVDEQAGTASAETSVLLFTWEDAAGASGLPSATGPAIGDFSDRFVLTADGWRIAVRQASLSARASAP